MISIDSNGQDRKQRTRKRTRNQLKWKAAIKKRKFQSGDEYVIQSNGLPDRLIPAKLFKSQVSCSCRFRCSQKIDTVAQKSHFDQFHQLKNWTQKTLQLKSLVKRANGNLNSINFRKKIMNKYYLADLNGV